MIVVHACREVTDAVDEERDFLAPHVLRKPDG